MRGQKQDGGRVKIYIERPDEQYGFKHAICWLPQYECMYTLQKENRLEMQPRYGLPVQGNICFS